MKITVFGLWHLGMVTAACLASVGHEVIGFENNSEAIDRLKKGEMPIFEPGLEEMVSQSTANGNLRFTSLPEKISEAEIIWVTFDTPVDDNDRADTDFVLRQMEGLLPYVSHDSLIMISSQLPIGSTRYLIQLCNKKYGEKNISFSYSPENLRLGKAIEVFTKPDRVIIGVQSEKDKPRIEKMLEKFTSNIIWMSIESAEMTKHALNAFLATSVVFINELATICEQVGADAKEVERGLKSEVRIGPRAYLSPGNAFAGGTLARDIVYLINAGNKSKLETKLFSAVLDSNEAHKKWLCKRLSQILGNLSKKNIAILGLTYKAGTNTLRRSSAIELASWLSQQNAQVFAYDPVIDQLPAELEKIITLKKTCQEVLKDMDALVISTEWQEFKELTSNDLISLMKQPIIFDQNSFLEKTLGLDDEVTYISVGRVK